MYITIIVICIIVNRLFTAANVNILNRDTGRNRVPFFIRIRYLYPKKIEETSRQILSDLRHFPSQLVALANRIRGQRVSKLSYLGIIIRGDGGGVLAVVGP